MAAIEIRVKRCNPAAGERPHWRTYRVVQQRCMSVLDALFAILEHEDATLAFRYSCRAGMCGSCAMIVNGREQLACRARLADLRTPVEVEPLRSLPVIKDLLVDMEPFFAKYARVEPQYVASDASLVAAAPEPARVDPAGTVRRLVNREIDCIACGACYSACPVVATVPAYLGPAALNRAAALMADERDAHGAARLAVVSSEGGVHACRGVGNCTTVCPVDVNPWLSIQLLRGRTRHG